MATCPVACQGVRGFVYVHAATRLHYLELLSMI